ncbi:Intramolecular chaperone auto-processing domain containing protein [uncultured Caudovirales phage]|uniref:Intramolecular chaperone auto-processing domain containing protein n=1 Tax=uncultured Caudovirales phage TaxID=2100421 RepID=A0A6J5MBP0_9CAUD|nr:Intramolecular chaperone auto-processing domain containing protein [uncultured Caudovirales phage]CAB4158350.1 Intramolecular chaperone auto-processing domain containing protein [uncultured Caudovirales phage]
MAEGYKAWSGGQVLNAQDLTDYASSQAVMRFANAAGRDAALTVSVVKEGMLAYLKDSNILTVNTDGTTSGWVQIYPVITATITDSQVTNAKLAASSVSSSNIIDGTITGTDIASATIQPGNMASGTYGINISGNAATATSASSATNASYASSAGDADLLNGLADSTADTPNSIASRNSAAQLIAHSFNATGGSIGAFRDTGTYTYVGFGCARVINSTDVYSQAVSSARTVLINSNLTLGTSTSSARFKEDIENLDYDPADILQLRPIVFRYRADHVEPGAVRDLELGLIAEEVAALGFEELIFRDKDGNPDGIAYEKLAVLLVKVCQDQQTQLDALSARLDKIGA